MALILVDAADLRRRGLNNEAEVVESLEEMGDIPHPSRMPPAIITMEPDGQPSRGDYRPSAAPVSSPGRDICDSTSSAAHVPATAGSAPGSPSSSVGEVARTGSGTHGGGELETAAGSDATMTGSAAHGQGEHANPQSHNPTGIDPTDPLAGLYSERLRTSLEREAFRTADTIAQDSAIAERVLSPAARALLARAQGVGHEPLPFDISRVAQEARIAALNGEIPTWARGNPGYDPALTRAAEPAPSCAPVQARSEALDHTATDARVPSPRVRDDGFER